MKYTNLLDTIITGDSLAVLKTLPDESVDCCVTSPPYYALRDYGVKGQIGRESTPSEYIARLTEVFREVRRVLKKDGTLWLNIADTYVGTGGKTGTTDPKYPKGRSSKNYLRLTSIPDCKPKDMIGIPWLLALALRKDGWYLRSDIVWMKGNAMPESVKDRPSRCYEHVFLLAKSRQYYYDTKSIAEPIAASIVIRMKYGRSSSAKYSSLAQDQKTQRINETDYGSGKEMPLFRNKRDVWLINTVACRGAHYAAFPPKLAETCIVAGCPKNGVVLDPFFGSGTVGVVAKSIERRYVGIELNPFYCELAKKRIGGSMK